MKNHGHLKNTENIFSCKILLLIPITIFLSGNFTRAFAEEKPTIFSSGNTRINLIELYTSEGCSSCPPADFWLNDLRNNNDLWNQFIPLAFHVDYWDYLGWKDTFSRAVFSQRQRRYNKLGQVNGVYTPGMFLNGKEWKKWRGENPKNFQLVQQDTPVGNLELIYSPEKISINYTPPSKAEDKRQDSERDETTIRDIKLGRVYIALMGFDLESSVKSGENRGREFKHNFVVLELLSSNIQLQQGVYKANINKFSSPLDGKDYAIVAWLTHDGDSKPLQATGGWLTTTRE